MRPVHAWSLIGAGAALVVALGAGGGPAPRVLRPPPRRLPVIDLGATGGDRGIRMTVARSLTAATPGPARFVPDLPLGAVETDRSGATLLRPMEWHPRRRRTPRDDEDPAESITDIDALASGLEAAEASLGGPLAQQQQWGWLVEDYRREHVDTRASDRVPSATSDPLEGNGFFVDGDPFAPLESADGDWDAPYGDFDF